MWTHKLAKVWLLVATSSYQPLPQLPGPHFCNLTAIVLLWWTHHCPVYGSICASIAPLEALWLYLGHISVVMFLNCCPKAPKARPKWGVYSAQTPPLTHSKLSVVCQPGKKYPSRCKFGQNWEQIDLCHLSWLLTTYASRSAPSANSRPRTDRNGKRVNISTIRISASKTPTNLVLIVNA